MGKLSKNNSNIELLHAVRKTISSFGMMAPNDCVLMGVSGGPDSVALVHILRELFQNGPLKLGVAHLDHGLRGETSRRDAAFVESLSARLGLPFYSVRKDVYSYRAEKRLCLEEAARNVRYDFFFQTARENGYTCVALGHTGNDNAELVLMNLLRGSGMRGLSGIPPVRWDHDGVIKVVRPLIRVKRSRLIKYLASKKIRYILDETNEDLRFLRNRIRNQLLPELKTAYNPNIIETLNIFSAITGAEDAWANRIVEPLFIRCVLSIDTDRVVLSVPHVSRCHVAEKRRILRSAIEKVKGNLRRISFSHIEAAVTLLTRGPVDGQLDFPDNLLAVREGERLSIMVKPSSENQLNHPKPLAFQYEIKEPGRVFIREIGKGLVLSETNLETIPALGSTGPDVAFFDRDKVEFPLTIRSIRKGDRFSPLGMTGSQKLKKFFTNRKIPPPLRAGCPLLISRGKIIWVAGYRMDESVRIDSGTNRLLKGELFLA